MKHRDQVASTVDLVTILNHDQEELNDKIKRAIDKFNPVYSPISLRQTAVHVSSTYRREAIYLINKIQSK